MLARRQAAFAAILLALAAPALAAEPQGHLGAAGQPAAAPVLVLRGTPSERAQAASASPSAARTVLTGGQRLWLLEPASGALTACTFENTANVGQHRIVCAQRSIPAHTN